MSNAIRCLFVFGTRPEAIKLAPLIRELRARTGQFDVQVCATAQHRQMLDQVLDLFQIQPDFDLNVMAEGQDLFGVTSKILLGMKNVINIYRPDWVVVHGDTTTTLAASLAGFYERLNVAHIEAGLRTYERFSPFPEEINRQCVSRIASAHFAPTVSNMNNLLSEGIPKSCVFVTGNTVIDALYWMRDKLRSDPKVLSCAMESLAESGYQFSGRQLILITGHRRENFGARFEEICRAILDIAKAYPEIDIVYPVHLNPNIRDVVRNFLGNEQNIHLIPAVGYSEFVLLMSRSLLVLTDSGGVQEEAPSLGVPVLVMREHTERREAIDAGSVELVGVKRSGIVKAVSNLIENESVRVQRSRIANPYGDGLASRKIADILGDEMWRSV